MTERRSLTLLPRMDTMMQRSTLSVLTARESELKWIE